MSTQLAMNSNQQTGITDFLSKPNIRANVMQAIGKERTTRFISSVISAVQATPALKECTNNSILSAALQGEALNLAPSPQLGQFYMVPYKKRDKKGSVVSIEATFQLGAKGYKQLAMRSGQYYDLDVMSIKEGEYIGRNPETGKHMFNFVSDDDEREELPTIGYMAYFELLNGFKKQIYWSKKKMLNHADTYSQAFNKADYERLIAGKIPEKELWKYSLFWYKNFDEMAEKTMIRQLISKWGIMSIEMQTAYEKDMAVIDENGNPVYVDNPQNTQSVQEQVSNDLKAANTKKFPEADDTVENPQQIKKIISLMLIILCKTRW